MELKIRLETIKTVRELLIRLQMDAQKLLVLNETIALALRSHIISLLLLILFILLSSSLVRAGYGSTHILCEHA